jgi:hypothetical protein
MEAQRVVPLEEIKMKRQKRIELTEVRRIQLATKIFPERKILRLIGLELRIVLESQKSTSVIYRDGDCRPDDPHDIWDRLRTES